MLSFEPKRRKTMRSSLRNRALACLAEQPRDGAFSSAGGAGEQQTLSSDAATGGSDHH
ncbi:MAG: hypothetical protein GWN21_01670 [Gammaproteobacteria bacterium]|nr:hypothetical protein [Gammaproteobacteria bacterium]NIR22546.1 hypothetical protein [Gammaproteobacteria bacterium]NIS04118.1 hypothetical protein [Gammaproteobacteria bacterium]NIU42170.1 hypothetical protein [Gammaproteobacteria bacterium]NIV46133.1 hypothetical protein [Gammaproteobacteria bacterium]